MRGDWLGKFRRERRVLALVRRAAWWLEQAEKERDSALASARAGGVSGGGPRRRLGYRQPRYTS
ncbi:hypothetical protein ACIQFZ_41350 [Streptomyces sp. NPDC093064]|uniref:hypothetical protein n=1 Tax=Streptomyces sp. NPDC093064 TaxID=3366020 RepID=UPI00381A2095